MKLRSRSLSLASNTQFNSTRTSQKRFITPNNGSTSPCITEYRPSLPKLTKIESLVVLKGNNSRHGDKLYYIFRNSWSESGKRKARMNFDGKIVPKEENPKKYWSNN